MSSDQVLAKLLEKLNSRLLVQEEHGFQKRAKMCPLAMGAPKKKPGLHRVKRQLSRAVALPCSERSMFFRSC